MPQTIAMNRITSANSEHETPEAAVNDAELQKLQRQFRLLEADRKAYGGESKIILYKQKATIDSLKKENTHLQEQIKLLQAMTEAKMTIISGSIVTSAEDQKEIYDKKIKGLFVEISEIDTIIMKKLEDIETERSKLGGVNAASENIDSIEKQIKIMENRLDKALVKYNKSLATNKKLRETIDNLRRERITFDKLAKKFQKEIAEQKKIMLDLIEQSNAAYEARDEAQARLFTLREKAEKEFQAYIQEVKELDRNIEHDRRLRDFLLTKAVDREEDSAKKLLHKDKEENFGSGNSLTNLIEEYDSTLKELEDKTGQSDIKEMLKKYRSIEEDNFSLFIYVNEIINDVEQVSDECNKMQKKIDTLNSSQKNNEIKRKSQMTLGEKQLNKYEQENNENIQKHAEVDLTLKNLMESITKLAQIMTTISSPFTEETESNKVEDDSNENESRITSSNKCRIRSLIGNPNVKINVTEENSVEVLGLIESETNDVITLNHIFSYTKKNTTTQAANQDEQVGVQATPSIKVSMPLSGTIVKLVSGKVNPLITKLSIPTPTTVGDDELDDEELRLLTKSELKERISTRYGFKGVNKQ